MTTSHTPDTCIQSPTLHQIQITLNRVAVAMEQIAAQGAAVAAHEKRLDGHDKRFDRQELHFAELYNRVGVLEKHQAREDGVEAVEDGKKRFWTEVKLKLITPALVGLFFLLWMADRFGAITSLVEQWHAFGGK